MGNISRLKVIAGVAIVVLIWGTVWPIYKIALNYAPPILFAGLRSILGGLLFSAFLLPKWREIRFKEVWHIFIISAIFNVIIFYGLQSIGLQYLPAGLFSVIVYLQPVLVVLLAWLWLKEPLTTMKISGIIIGFLGVIFVSFDGITGKVSAIGILLALITGIGWAIGTVYVKKKSSLVNGLWLVAMQNIIGGIVFIIIGMGTEDITSIDWNLPFIATLLYGAVFGVTLAFVIYNKLMSAGEASKVSSFTFLVPLISVLIGTLFLNEPFTYSLLIGMVLILGSIYMINRKNIPH
ncbi:DMT family transporter [Lysinibacillus telephonicus]|uniref:DMT family transporter n=1 Tax=Lysinibacillus telephonicus TaxID=1714840 RepID=A0A3S0HNU1_9BACI|nr:DMT family transporter [Lysinibacillus telephonicus]RTQ96142.1 DMT family transporter [Lysinibacillus telephonicus]